MVSRVLERYTIISVYLCPVVVFQFMCFRVIYVLPKGKTEKTGETEMAKKTTWVARGLRAEKPGKRVWTDLKAFDNAADADNWLCNYVRANGLSITDFTVSRR